MDNEIRRLASFSTCPTSKVRPSTLARFGFYYVTNIFSIVCHACQFTLESFQSDAEVESKHQYASPNCKYVLENPKNNSDSGVKNNKENVRFDYVAKGEKLYLSTIADGGTIFKNNDAFRETLNSISNRKEKAFDSATNTVKNNESTFCNLLRKCDDVQYNDRSDGVPPKHKYESDSHETPYHSSQPRSVHDYISQNYSPSGAVPSYKVKHPAFADKEKRLQSFQGKPNVPNYHHTNPKTLAESGFFHQGPADNVRCFCCDGGLKNFQPDDDVWREHARWFPRCSYLCEQKDQAYIKAAELPSQNIQNKNASGQAAGGSYVVDPREVKARMESPMVKIILDIGHSRDLIRQAIEQQLLTKGDDFSNAESLLNAMFALENTGTAAASKKTPEIDSAAKQTPIWENDQENEVVTTLSATSSTSSTTSQSTTLVSDSKIKKSKKSKSKNKNDSSSAPIAGTTATSDALNAGTLNAVDTETKTLLDENGRLREARQCKVCLDKEVDTVFLPCGHLVCCNSCAPELKNCPVCRALIRGTVRVFLT